MNSAADGPRRRMPQLDTLRAFAVTGVMIEHWLPKGDVVRDELPSDARVCMFFVLSGFLITGLLLRAREAMRHDERGLGEVLRSFYVRRFIRLMPIYYLYLAVWAVMMPATRHHLWAFVLHLQNFLFAARPEVFSVMMAHFWTLAVEEQFYLTWPLLILLTPRRALLPVLAGTICLGPALRAVGLHAGFTSHQIGMMTPAHFETLAFGGLLAYLRASGEARENAWGERLTSVGFWVGLPLTIVVGYLGRRHPTVGVVFHEATLGLLFVWLVGGASRGFRGPGGALLDLRPLQYIGRISYGLYVFHFNVPGMIRTVLAPRMGLALPLHPWLRFPIYALGSLGLASISWFAIERPLSRWHRRLEAQRRPITPPVTA
jgi:peptidoglycan/LPS O-acetylase OafA/YrhL